MLSCRSQRLCVVVVYVLGFQRLTRPRYFHTLIESNLNSRMLTCRSCVIHYFPLYKDVLLVVLNVCVEMQEEYQTSYLSLCLHADLHCFGARRKEGGALVANRTSSPDRYVNLQRILLLIWRFPPTWHGYTHHQGRLKMHLWSHGKLHKSKL